ncbi:G-D-S-L family lipolytic protein [Winogradskyella psychrotolerans]|uniref:G-D-S-L family lipolytic protein n=1 Tax=Winogradskyella psychrotolerans TaxID=1344585 RepID=UPI001C066A26|nr:G-D-S-L family lipolytic protein [Winogradskyella psychrotolerans]MBU2928006.1 G-D-S-L family lipolytic protein [Winogradskyella psychrotolerans]
MKNIKYLLLSAVLIGFTACNDEEDFEELLDNPTNEVVLPELTAGSADFSTYVAIGNSLTAGFTDNALFIAGQENSMPNMLSQKFALLGGGTFTQPLMEDNIGGLLFGGSQNEDGSFGPRLYFDGSGPASLPAMSSTEAFAPSLGSQNNMGVPGAASFHLLYDGYGNPANLVTDPPTANPYFVRMASDPSATILGDALAQQPTFVSLWIGNNDVLNYATSGGDQNEAAITPQLTFEGSIDAIIGALQTANVQGVMANIPYVTTIPHFTTVPHNPVPLDATTAGFLNSASAYGAYNGGLDGTLAYLIANPTQLAFFFPPTDEMTSEELATAEMARRKIYFSEGSGNAVVIMDEDLTDLTAINPALVSMRQATEDDLLVLPASSFIGTEAVPGNPTTVNGVAIPLADKWVLTPQEQDEIKTATDNFNIKLEAAATSAGFAFVDANSLMSQLDNGGYSDGNFILTSSLVTGGAFSLDGVHPTARGYALLANEFMKKIDETYDSNFEASGNLLDIGNYPTNYPTTLQ